MLRRARKFKKALALKSNILLKGGMTRGRKEKSIVIEKEEMRHHRQRENPVISGLPRWGCV